MWFAEMKEKVLHFTTRAIKHDIRPDLFCFKKYFDLKRDKMRFNEIMVI